MFYSLSKKYNKATAWFLFSLFYLQLISPVFAHRTAGNPYIPYHSTRAKPSLKKAQSYVQFDIASNKLTDKPGLTLNKLSRKTNVQQTGVKFEDEWTTEADFGPGPTQPEMQSFQSVNTNNMVDLFTGDFSYSIPLLDVGGYPVNLHYSSGITMDQESSWVGLGWNINPGTINRNMRGLPDDFNGTEKITKVLSMKANQTIGVTVGGSAELIGKPIKPKPTPKNGNDSTVGRPTTLGASIGVFHNNYNGWGTETGINTGINSGRGSKGHLSGGLSITNNSQSGLDVSPSFSLRMAREEARTQGFISVGTNYNSRLGVQSLQLTAERRKSVDNDKTNSGNKSVAGLYGVPVTMGISFATPSFTPGVTTPFTSQQFSFTAKVGGEKWAYHPSMYVQGSYSNQYIDDKDMETSIPAYGYLYYQDAKDQEKVLLDFNREKEVAFRGTTPSIAIPGYTYDIYSVSGEGTGGMFRPHRGDIGMIYDHAMSTKSSSDRVSLDLGFGSRLHVGVDLNKVWANSKNNPWRQDNVMARYIGFKTQDSLYENVYFKNPGEKVSVDQEFYNKIGDDKLVRVQLSPKDGHNSSVVSATRNLTQFENAKESGTSVIEASSFKNKRDKRTQVISYLTAKDASVAGLDKEIKSYNINSFPSTSCNTNYSIIKRIDDIRKPNHLSEITVLGTDGRRHIYGTPAYNIEQQDATFAVEKSGGDNATGLVVYDPLSDNSTNNKKGKDNYFSEETVPAYAHSFLLSDIVSADYVDITGDGVTEDDNGDAVKFNYSRVYGSKNPYRWRAPFEQNKASYNEGLKTYSRDDKGTYSYGRKEVWYMNSIESKTMIATFVLETDSIRHDSYGVKNKNGGRDSTQRLYRLKQINLYTKADFLKNGTLNAKPVKTVHFDYSYELCPGVPSSNNTGKLTLKKVWFSYNKNYKGQLNPYTFKYHATNHGFDSKSYDRWGNYKDPGNNPGTTGGSLTNAEYPYALQKGVKAWDSTQAASNVAAWTLNEIKLPSGGVMKVGYESDDYAYVQNRRAMQMFSIEGLGNSPTATPSNLLYAPGQKRMDYDHVFIRLSEPVSGIAEVRAKYLEDVKKIYFKFFVKMPDGKDAGRWGTGYEQVPCFAEILDFGIKANSQNKTIWIQVKPLKNGRTPMATAAIQYLRVNHPDKAFAYSEPGDNVKLKDAIGMIISSAANIRNSIDGFDDQARDKNRCNDIIAEKSFIRLQTPDFKKFGGGLRVKKVEIFDNWQKMGAQTEATYGQKYDYSTTKLVNGVSTRISSGVSTYEPALGREENPFYQPIEYAEKMAALGPTDYVFTEEPLGESFFPSSSVGYSKVTVQTINHTKKSANGMDVTEFFTAKEFPTIFENTPLDDQSKKTFANPIGNFFKFDAKRFVTLSQGFKVELNDMHGKVKAQYSFAQTDLVHPLTSTINYYKLDNDNALSKHLSNKVSTADSTNGVINANAVMGKDVDMLIDIREQTSKTVSASVQVNVDIPKILPLIILPSLPSLPTFETNRYRSIAVTKIVNRYGILDSVVHIDKGSKISTANMVYDGETGNVLLSRTQNEFDDPVYSFNYPAYWAYSGMGNAYKNLGGLFKNVQFLNGKMEYKGLSPAELSRYFESGDEILLTGRIAKYAPNPLCTAISFTDLKDTALKVWAIEMKKTTPGIVGIYFIDKDGNPITASASTIRIIRSGKRNMLGVSAGAITSLQNPIRIVSGTPKLVFDSTTSVIAATAASFKDFWKVDSSTYRKDTVMFLPTLIQPKETQMTAISLKGIRAYKRNSTLGNWCPSFKYFYDSTNRNFTSYTKGFGYNQCQYTQERLKSSVLFPNFDGLIPQNSVITSAYLYLSGPKDPLQTWGRDYDNSAYVARPLGLAMVDYMSLGGSTSDAFFNANLMQIDNSTKVFIAPTTPKNRTADEFFQSGDVSTLVQGMVNNYYSSNKKNRPSLVLDQQYNSIYGNSLNEMAFGFLQCSGKGGQDCRPRLEISYIPACANGTAPYYSATPTPGYYCNSQPIDTFVCKPNINDTATNPYRWGIFGSWRSDRAYSYYNSRKDSTSTSVTNIRKDGEIRGFMPYWGFTSTYLQPSVDSSRWVWNSEINLVNSKGLELQNHDPLDRYNSAQYGYNQTLPVAVAQNSQSREMMFDGFEDYGYRTDTCKSCPTNRFINMVASGTLVDTVSHTGLYSLRVPGNFTNSVVVPISTFTADTALGRVIGKVSNTKILRTKVDGVGAGLNAQYTRTAWPMSSTSRIDPTINFNWSTGALFGGTKDYVSVVWSGWIQPRYSEYYTFYGSADDNMQVKVNGTRISASTRLENTVINDVPLQPIFLNAGQLYPIEVKYNENTSVALAKLEWQSTSQQKEVVPQLQLYTVNYAPSSTVTQDSIWCNKVDSLKSFKMTLNRFSPLQNRKMVISTWVKEKNNNADTTTNFRNVQIMALFSDGSTTTSVTLKPSGYIIEGWQRIEETVTIPATAIQMTLQLMSTSASVPVFFDDVRIHPFNSNLKSFVYNPLNIRLMAELDENNYASFYEYDDDGTLIRVKKETERGIKTIKETRSALLKD